MIANKGYIKATILFLTSILYLAMSIRSLVRSTNGAAVSMWYGAAHALFGVFASFLQIIIQYLFELWVGIKCPRLDASALAAMTGEGSGEVCPICLCDHSSNSCKLPCGHVLHSSCLIQMLRHHAGGGGSGAPPEQQEHEHQHDQGGNTTAEGGGHIPEEPVTPTAGAGRNTGRVGVGAVPVLRRHCPVCRSLIVSSTTLTDLVRQVLMPSATTTATATATETVTATATVTATETVGATATEFIDLTVDDSRTTADGPTASSVSTSSKSNITRPSDTTTPSDARMFKNKSSKPSTIVQVRLIDKSSPIERVVVGGTGITELSWNNRTVHCGASRATGKLFTRRKRDENDAEGNAARSSSTTVIVPNPTLLPLAPGSVAPGGYILHPEVGRADDIIEAICSGKVPSFRMDKVMSVNIGRKRKITHFSNDSDESVVSRDVLGSVLSTEANETHTDVSEKRRKMGDPTNVACALPALTNPNNRQTPTSTTARVSFHQESESDSDVGVGVEDIIVSHFGTLEQPTCLKERVE